MNKRFLNKKNCLLLKQPLPENISQKARLKGKEKRAKFKADSSQNKPDYTWQYTAYAHKLSKLDRMRQAEIQIVRELLQKKRFEDVNLGVSGKCIENNIPKVCFLQNKQTFKNTTRTRAGYIEASPLAKEKKTSQQKKSLSTPVQQLTLLPAMPTLQNKKTVEQKKQHKINRTYTIISDSPLNYASSEPSKFRIQACTENDCSINLPAPKVYKQREKLSISSLFSIKSQKEEFQPQQIPKELVAGCALLLLSIEQIRNILVSKRIERKIPSELRNQLLESKKIRFFYGGLSKRELKKSIKKARQLLGNATENLLIVLESRLDVALKRCGFFSSIRSARQSVIHKRIQINNKIVSTPGYQLQPGDLIKVQPVNTYLTNTKENADEKKESWGQSYLMESLHNYSYKKKPLQKAEQPNSIKKYSTLDSLLQLEFLLSSICSENQEHECGAVLQAKALHYGALLFIFKQKSGVRLVLRGLHTAEKTFLRFDKLVQKSQLCLAFQNRGESKTQHFIYLFTKQLSSKLKSSFQEKDCIDKDFALNFSSNLFEAVGPYLSLHLQQIFSEEQQATLTKAHLSTKVVKEQKAILPFDHTFYNIYFYWLQITKRLFLQDAKKQLLKSQNVLCHLSDTARFQHRKTKPLHLEVSYQSLSAIFLYPPQQIYLPALVNVDLLLKSL